MKEALAYIRQHRTGKVYAYKCPTCGVELYTKFDSKNGMLIANEEVAITTCSANHTMKGHGCGTEFMISQQTPLSILAGRM